MQLPTELTPAQRAALVECLRVFADCGHATRETHENKMQSSVEARGGGDKHRVDLAEQSRENLQKSKEELAALGAAIPKW
jgi:hypothetical protein